LQQYGKLESGENNGEKIEAFAWLIFTPHCMRGFFRGCGYMD
jgi:hypothetical protein